jgi:hypothetical protein
VSLRQARSTLGADFKTLATNPGGGKSICIYDLGMAKEKKPSLWAQAKEDYDKKLSVSETLALKVEEERQAILLKAQETRKSKGNFLLFTIQESLLGGKNDPKLDPQDLLNELHELGWVLRSSSASQGSFMGGSVTKWYFVFEDSKQNRK